MMSRDTGWVDQHGEIDVEVVNGSGLSRAELDPHLRELGRQLQSWTNDQRGRTSKGSSMLSRDKYVAPDNPFTAMATARTAVEQDDIVGSAVDVLEGLMFDEVSWESSDKDAEDLMNWVSGLVNLDGYLRTVHREMFTYSQSVTAARWARRTFKLRTKPNAKARRRQEITLMVPVELTTLDPQKVVPVGESVFGYSMLAWNATAGEADLWAGRTETFYYDPIMVELFDAHYTPSRDEEAELSELGVNTKSLILLRRDRVWRHTATKSSFDRFPALRMRQIFPHLDQKQHLMEADRVALVGSANYILLVKKGDKDSPALQPEIDNLKENFTSIAKLPVVISDHRLNIEIITPKTDHTLKPERYDLLDRRIIAKLFGSLDVLEAGQSDAGGQRTTQMIRSYLQTQRRMLRREVEKRLVQAIWEHPENREALEPYGEEKRPSLVFSPRQIRLDNDSTIVQAMLQLRQSREISRQSLHQYFGFDQQVEADRVRTEAELYDDIFKTIVPHGSPEGNVAGGDATTETDATAGARGGRPAGGGQGPQSTRGVRSTTTSGNAKK